MSSTGKFRKILGVVRANRALKIAAALALGALAIEAAAYIWYGTAHGVFYGAGKVFRAQQSPTAESTSWQERRGRRVQPFSGFTTRRPSDERNIHPPRQGGDAIVIGVFGGYFADGIARALRPAVAQRLSEIGVDVEPAVVDLAIAWGRQPQQLMTAINQTAHGARFDIVVNLDGVDDLSPLGNDRLLALAPEVIGGTATAMEQYVAAQALREERRSTLHAGQGWLGFSAAFGLALHSRIDRLERDIDEADAAAAKRRDSLRHLRREAPTAREDLFDAARLWYRSSAMMGRVAQAAGADYYHVLQPSPYIAGSKRLTEQERADAFDTDNARGNRYAAMYPVLVGLGRELTRPGAVFVDLTGAFRESDETVYSDCCNLTPRGRALLAEAIVPHIEPSVVAKDGAAGEPARNSGNAAASDILQARAHYDVYLRGAKHLVYKRNSCDDEDTSALFFLHVLPRRADDLEGVAAEHGFDNMDFDFADGDGMRIGDRCIVERRLPDYEVEQLRTGQYGVEKVRPMWQAHVSIVTQAGLFKVFRRGVDGLVYKKADCTWADVQHPFFLLVRPMRRVAASDQLMTSDGYANLDFTVNLDDVLRDDGSCFIERTVPFEFVDLTTGQYNVRTLERVWQRDIDRA